MIARHTFTDLPRQANLHYPTFLRKFGRAYGAAEGAGMDKVSEERIQKPSINVPERTKGDGSLRRRSRDRTR